MRPPKCAANRVQNIKMKRENSHTRQMHRNIKRIFFVFSTVYILISILIVSDLLLNLHLGYDRRNLIDIVIIGLGGACVLLFILFVIKIVEVINDYTS